MRLHRPLLSTDTPPPHPRPGGLSVLPAPLAPPDPLRGAAGDPSREGGGCPGGYFSTRVQLRSGFRRAHTLPSHPLPVPRQTLLCPPSLPGTPPETLPRAPAEPPPLRAPLRHTEPLRAGPGLRPPAGPALPPARRSPLCPLRAAAPRARLLSSVIHPAQSGRTIKPRGPCRPAPALPVGELV